MEDVVMKRKIAVIDATRVSLAPVDNTVAALYPELEVIHLMDEGMSFLAKEEGRISGANLSRMVSLINRAESLGVDGILLSCTIFSPYIELLRSFADIPIIAADVAMFEKATADYRNIGVVVTFQPTVRSVSEVLEKCREKGMEFNAEIRVAEGAFAALSRGSEEEHNNLVAECARGLSESSDAIVLAQMSHMRAVPLLSDLKVPVLTSPPVSLKLLMDKIEER
jgi:Asp/Glu/hydantoin racemase